jgi:hypothetical protein
MGAFEHVGGRKTLQWPNQAQTDSIQRRGDVFHSVQANVKSASVCLNHTTMSFLHANIVLKGRLSLSLSEWETANQEGDPRHAPGYLY